MTFKKIILGALCSFTLLFVASPAKAIDPLICLAFDITNAWLTPMPVADPPTKQAASVTTAICLLLQKFKISNKNSQD